MKMTQIVDYIVISLLSILGCVSAVSVDITPREAVVEVGKNLSILCRTGVPLSFCRFEFSKIEESIILGPAFPVPDHMKIKYFGDGWETGQCGATIGFIEERFNGDIKCSVSTKQEAKESSAKMRLIVAKRPERPVMKVLSKHDRQGFKDGDQLLVTCSIQNSRPAANISWYIGDDRVYSGLTPVIRTVTPTNDLYTTEQNLTRRLTYLDNGKELRCSANHVLLDPTKTLYTNQKFDIKFGPRVVREPIERFGYELGREGIVEVLVYANPKPTFTWTKDGIRLRENEVTAHYQSKVVNNGSGLWNISLIINALSEDDIEKQFSLNARNEYGDRIFNVKLYTSPKPPDTDFVQVGIIIGAVAAALVVLLLCFLLLFARVTGRWCFSGGSSLKNDHESSDTESAEHNLSEKSKKPKKNLNYIFKKKKDKVAADEESFKEVSNAPEKPVSQSPDIVYAELDLNSAPRPLVRVEDDKTEYAEIIHTKTGEDESSDKLSQ